jgi:cytochrome c-type biogenesis protein CcmH/NrfF
VLLGAAGVAAPVAGRRRNQAEHPASLAEGKTSQQILDVYVAEYGDRICRPAARGVQPLIYVAPRFLVASVGLVVVVISGCAP